MRVHIIYIWKDCWLWRKEYRGMLVDAFWLACTEQESKSFILPKLSPEIQKIWLSGRVIRPSKYGEYFFLVTSDGKHVKCFPERAITTGLMKANHNYLPVEREIQYIEDIPNLLY